MEYMVRDVVKIEMFGKEVIGTVLKIQENNVVVLIDGEEWKVSPKSIKLLKRKEHEND